MRFLFANPPFSHFSLVQYSLQPKVKPIEHYMHFLRGRFILSNSNKHVLNWRAGYRVRETLHKKPISFLQK